jgi:hypothetical protein
MQESGWIVLVVFGLLFCLLAFAHFKKYCCMREEDDAGEEAEDDDD